VGAVYSWWVSSTSPFTSAADVAVAVGFGLMAVVAGTTFFGRRDGADQGRRAARPTSRTGPPAGEHSRSRAWVVTLSLVSAVELFTYIAGSTGNRHDFPTISSLYDAAAESQAAKAAIVFAWLVLGWALFHRAPDSPGPAPGGPR
jgi:hypothetical protein